MTTHLPVPEAVGIPLGVSADHGHESEAEDDEDQDDLASGKPELCEMSASDMCSHLAPRERSPETGNAYLGLACRHITLALDPVNPG